jgi:cyclophilin family peptidyl-prolyl cis-trans isomerase
MKRLILLAVLATALTPLAAQAQGQNPVVVMETNHGTIKIELYAKEAPITVKNFLDYVDAKHYDGTIFHRIIPDFMIQGGGFTQDMKQKPTKDAIVNESKNGLKNLKYTIAMARTSLPNSATCQFFINTVDNAFLDKANAKDGVGYCVFGKVIAGQQVVEKIKAVPTGAMDVPTQPVIIMSVTRAKQ